METTATVNNGVDVVALLAARQALSEAPEAAKCLWRASCDWVKGTHSNSRVESFYALGTEHHHKTAFTFAADHPELFSAEDRGATPVEMVLVGLAGCLTAGIASVAQNRGIQLHSVTATLEATMDLQGILGVDSEVRNGFEEVRVTFVVDADAGRDDILALVAQSQKRSAVFDIITNPTSVQVAVK